jgi:hypothetical protein
MKKMDIVSDKLKSCGVKIIASVKEVDSIASGVIYVTPNYFDYNYVLTAKHTFQEDSLTEFDVNKVTHIEILYSHNRELKQLEYYKRSEIKNVLIDFEEDFVVILIKKNESINFPQILVSDKFNAKDNLFFAWGIFSANPNELNKFDFENNDSESKRLKLKNISDPKSLHGLSGAGVFSTSQSILYGIIKKYPTENFQNETIDCTILSFTKINEKLESLNKAKLETKSSYKRRIIGNDVVDINQAIINGVYLNLELAKNRLETDIKDDWYHDPLNYIDLLNSDYLFKQFEPYFGKNKYKASLTEQFFVPKKTLTLRQALVSPFIDRIMYFAVVGVLANKLDRALIPNVYSARYNRYQDNRLIISGVEQWKKMKYQLADCSERYDCVIEIDLLNYYDNINKKLLYEKILRVCESDNEKNAANLLYNIIKNFTKKDIGLPQNSDASSLLASFYLNQVDVFMQHQVTSYYRFMDDIRIFCNNKYEARKLLQTMETELRRCHLSVNSQKTRIIELDSNTKKEYLNVYDLELNKVVRLKNSNNYAYLNESFHLSAKLLQDCLNEDVNDSDDTSRKLKVSLSVITNLGAKGISLQTQNGFSEDLETTINFLYDKPWITPQICKFLYVTPKDCFQPNWWKILETIVLDEKYNTYTWQTYQIWMLLAKHKYKKNSLVSFAVKSIERNDETIRPVIAAMMIYMGAIDENYRRVLLRKYGDNFTHGYFQNRISLISLRNFPTKIIPKKHINKTIADSHEFLYKYKDKDLVYIPGASEDTDNDIDFEQLYSL